MSRKIPAVNSPASRLCWRMPRPPSSRDRQPQPRRNAAPASALTAVAAFTLIELLVVIAIIAILASMVLVVANIMSASVLQAKTKTIIEHINAGLNTSVMENGRAMTSVTHPLAATADPKAPFMRAKGSPLFPYPLSSDPSSKWEALETLEPLNPGFAGSQRNRVIDADDVYVDDSVPLLYGVDRRRCRVISATSRWITTSRRIPLPNLDSPYIKPGVRPPELMLSASSQYDSTIYPDLEFLNRPAITTVNADVINRVDEVVQAATETVIGGLYQRVEPVKWVDFWGDSVSRAIALALGSEATVLNGLGAIRAPADLATDPLLDVTQHKTHAYRVRWTKSKATSTTWSPGRLRAKDGDGKWLVYGLHGSGLYDSYGRELLTYLNKQGRLVIESAGPDGVFKWLPVDGSYPNTDVINWDPANPPKGVKDGSKDNIK